MNESCLPSRPAVLRGKNVNVAHYTQTVQPIFFIYAMLIDTMDFFQLIQLSLTLTLPGSQGQLKAKTSRLYFLAHFSTNQDERLYGVEAIKVEHPDTTFE